MEFKSSKTLDLNPQPKFLEGDALSQVDDSILPNFEPKEDFSQE